MIPFFEIDKAITAANRTIELLKDYLIRLIADVVTGKLDVRQAAASLPEIENEIPEEWEEETELDKEEEMIEEGEDAE